MAREATYQVMEGPSPDPRFPGHGPYDERLGYSRLPAMLERADSAGFDVVSQARLSEGFERLLDRGVFPIYREKDRAGLVLLDARGLPFSQSLHPRRVYTVFDSVPPLVRDALLYIENRELLSPRRPNLNPAVEWDRLLRSVGDLALQKLGSDRNVAGGSTLATQIEKYRHSPEGRTSSASEKVRQMASASIRAYMDGPNTLEARRRILTDYLNSVPLAAAQVHGEVLGISDGLWAWYGTDFDEANRLLRADPGTLEETELSRRAQIYRQVLSLLLAQRRPSFYLASGSGQEALHDLTDQHLRRMMADGVIPASLGNAALEAEIVPLVAAPALPQPPFVQLKAQNQIRSSLLSRLGVSRLYELDRLDLTVETTIDLAKQEVATQFPHADHGPGLRAGVGLGHIPPAGAGGPVPGPLLPDAERAFPRREPHPHPDRQLQRTLQHQRGESDRVGIHGQAADPRHLPPDGRGALRGTGPPARRFPPVPQPFPSGQPGPLGRGLPPEQP